jgi:hypothetical protein
MTMKIDERKEGLSLPGLIDIIFLLLIFSLVTYSFTSSSIEGKDETGLDDQLNLPIARYEVTSESDKILHTLMFQIEHTNPDDASSPKKVYVLWPSVENVRTVKEAKVIALSDSMFASFNSDFLNQSDGVFQNSIPCRLIRNEIERYKRIHFKRPRASNTVAIRAVEDTEFRIINFIMDRCSAYGDTIPKMDLFTLTGRK